MADKSSKENFLSKLAVKFPENFDKYCYDKFEYINNSTKSTITCKFHGDFQQSAVKHLSGRGCRSCQYQKETLGSWLNKLINRFPNLNTERR